MIEKEMKVTYRMSAVLSQTPKTIEQHNAAHEEARELYGDEDTGRFFLADNR